jgi:hypothetical protein
MHIFQACEIFMFVHMFFTTKLFQYHESAEMEQRGFQVHRAHETVS